MERVMERERVMGGKGKGEWGMKCGMGNGKGNGEWNGEWKWKWKGKRDWFACSFNCLFSSAIKQLCSSAACSSTVLFGTAGFSCETVLGGRARDSRRRTRSCSCSKLRAI